MWSHKKVNFVHTKHAWGKHTVCLCILDNSLEAIFLSIFPEFSEPTGNQGEVDRKTLTGLHGQVPSHPHMRRPCMHHQPVQQQTSNLLNNKKSFQHFQSALTTGFIIGKIITVRQTNKQSVMQTEYETILDNVLSNMHQLQHGKCQESHNQKNWKKRRVLFERWSPDALTLKTSDYTVSIIKFALTANLVKTRVMGHFGSPAGSRMNQYLLSFLIMIHNWWVINKNKPTLDLGIPFSFSFFFIKSLI